MVFIGVGIFIAIFSKFIIFKSLERQMENINNQYNDLTDTENVKDNTEENNKNYIQEDDDDFLPILKIVKLITYILSSIIIIFGLLIIFIFSIYY